MKRIVSTLALLGLTSCGTMAKIGFICAGAIGAQRHNSTHHVLYVFKESPAAKLGIKKGDLLVDLDMIEGQPGDVVTVKWIREEGHVSVLHTQETKLECVDDIVERDYYINHSW